MDKKGIHKYSRDYLLGAVEMFYRIKKIAYAEVLRDYSKEELYRLFCIAGGGDE